ncbi:MAG: hypothetical protein IPL95_13530 [Saprospiraceae bacterium]|nr:hypothetical protein [Saprospiraceae bacterium]
MVVLLKHELPIECQISPIYGIEIIDFNKDGFNDFVLVGNNGKVNLKQGSKMLEMVCIMINDKNKKFIPIHFSKNQAFCIPKCKMYSSNSNTIK